MPAERRFLSFFVVSLSFLAACSAQSKVQHDTESARVDSLISQVHVGEPRSQVEKTLGRPYNVEKDGNETVMIYVTGPEQQAEDAQAAQRAALGAGIVTSLLGSLGSVGGNNNIGAATQIGTQVLDAGSTYNTPSNSTLSAEQTKIEVRLRGNKVVSVDRYDSGRVGIGADR